MSYSSSDLGVGKQLFAVTPAASAPLAFRARMLWVGGGGTVVAAGADGVDVTFLNVADGSYLYGEFLYVRSAGTTATGLVGLA
jgi:hypothetical protein